jgi:hypothetical protein
MALAIFHQLIAASSTFYELAHVDVGVAAVVDVLDQFRRGHKELGGRGGGGVVDFVEGFVELLAAK